MIQAKHCLICGGPITSQKRGLVAPFLAHRIWNGRPFPAQLAGCAICNFMFFNPRLEKYEEQRLYDNYRSKDYQEARFKYEPWYTESLNRNLGAPESVVHRRNFLISVLARYADLQKAESVIDFGGDRGQLIETLPITSKFVYDISGVSACRGVTALADFEECLAQRYDLIVCSHVLEHVSHPKDIIGQMSRLAHAGTRLYLEVPLESPAAFKSKIKRIVQALVLAFARPGVAVNILGPGMLYIMNEHVNFFTDKSLRALASEAGLETVASGRSRPKSFSILGSGSLWCLLGSNQ
jgi:hypothetical protein